MLDSWVTLNSTHPIIKHSRIPNPSGVYSNSEARGKTPLVDTTNLYMSHFDYSCQLSCKQEKDLINRLYKANTYEEREILKKQKD